MVVHLHEHNLVPREVRPSSLFISSNLLTLKIAHIEAFANSDLSKLDLVELQDLRYSCPESVLTSKGVDERSLIFAVGLIIA
jgi:ferredoxin-fold anticodon binding domain-containing protein